MNIEQRISKLERTNRRQRLVVAAMLGAGALAVMGGQVPTPTTTSASTPGSGQVVQSEEGIDVFGEPVSLPYFGSLPEAFPGVKRAGDLNNDGFDDLILRSGGDNQFYIALNTGFDAFQVVQTIDYPNNFIEVGDFNGDGLLDLVYGTTNEGDGQWNALVSYNLLGGQAACPPDFNKDFDVGFEDLVTLLAYWGPCDN